MSDEQRRIVPVILCGGSGTRLWPLSSPERPKQLLPLIAPQTMLELTLQRVRDRAIFSAPLIVASGHLAPLIAEQPWAADATIIAEPMPRNTAPAVALALFNCDPGDLLLVLPSDHAIEEVEAFAEAVQLGRQWAEKGWFVTFGMKAERAETGYGYIRRGSALASGVAQADAFVEKPDLETAERFVAEGIYDWNAGIFLFQAKSMVAALEAFVPDLEHACRAAVERQEEQGGCRLPHPASFSRSPAISLDYAVMEKAERIAVVPVALGWSDLGSWDSLFAAGATGPGGNLLTGRVIAKEVSGCLIRSDGPVVAALGIHDLVVVAAGGAVLVIPRGQGQRVKELVEALENTPAAAPQEASEPSDRQ